MYVFGLVSSANRTLLMQVGDGGIVVDTGVGLQLPIQPMTGEYANQTYFVTDMDALDYLAIKIVDAGVKHAAAFSDGIQRLAFICKTASRMLPSSPFLCHPGQDFRGNR